MKRKKLVFVLERVPVKLHAETVETLRHRGGAHGTPQGKRAYNRQDKSWKKEEI
ncbi:MAG: hypothetical protein WC819_03945 [Parcubacteria group bacterium]|jgi:hypothetical protein